MLMISETNIGTFLKTFMSFLCIYFIRFNKKSGKYQNVIDYYCNKNKN